MKTIAKYILLFAVLFWAQHSVFAQSENPVISAIQQEVERNKTQLRIEGMTPPFFISYSVYDRYIYSLRASLGSISNTEEFHMRFGAPILLVGNYLRNNLNLAQTAPRNPEITSLYDNASGIPLTIWKVLDQAYKSAIEQYKTKMAILQQQTQTKEEEELPDFEQAKPISMILQSTPVNVDKAYWENYLRKASEVAKQYPDILSSNASLRVLNVMTYTYNTEGSRYAVPSTFYQLSFQASVRADDGQELFNALYVENATVEQMPELATFSNQCKKTMEDLLRLKNAPLIDEAYSGPVLFEGLAVERIFRQTFFSNNKLVAARSMVRQQGSAGGNDFEMMLNKKVISRSLTIKSITGQEFYKGQRLNGYYPVDAEGIVPDKELMLIENGVLRNLLSGRKPTKKIKTSNGHNRFDHSSNHSRVMSGNIHISCNQTFSRDELRRKLLAAAKEEDLEYAYIVRHYDFGNNLIYKVYIADGREELVRGATVDDVNLKTFKRVLGASDREQMTNFGEVQTTVICPDAMLFEEMDIKRINNIEFKKPFIVPKPKLESK